MIFERILVPLDGSAAAEASLPVAGALGRRLGSVLVLSHAVEPNPPEAVHGQPHLSTFADAQAYLEDKRGHIRRLGLEAEVHVEAAMGSGVGRAIDELANRLDVGSIVMCAHGRRTLHGRLLGPIAQQALRIGHRPIVLRTAGARADAPFEIGHILMPIDLRHDLDRPTNAMLALAQAFGATVTLLHVSEPASTLQARLLPGTSAAMRGIEQQHVEQRLRELAERWRQEGIDVTVRLRDDAPDEAILEEAQRGGADVVILSTHARSGVAAWYERSVAQRLVQTPELTLLLLREPRPAPLG